MTVHGFIPTSSGSNTSFQTSKLWSKSFPSAETVLSVEPVGYEAVASFGRVLGDKSTVYKYLNPHLSVITTMSASTGTAHVSVLDTTTGAAVYEVGIRGVIPGKGVKAVMSENWLVYSWLEAGGWRIASVELYENRTESKIETYVASSGY